MANEVLVQLRMLAVKSELSVEFNPGDDYFDMATGAYQGGVVTVGTSEEDMPIGDVSAGSQGTLCIKNLDSTNYVDYGPKVSGAMEGVGRLYPGRSNLITLMPNKTIRWIANTAAVRVQMILLES